MSEETRDLNEMIVRYKNIDIEIYRLYNKITEYRKQKNVLEKQIYNMCEHVWERDVFDTGPYSSTTYICSKCNLYK